VYVYTNLIEQGYALSEFAVPDFDTPGSYTVDQYGTMDVSSTPEPSSLLLLGTGLLALVGMGWRRNSQASGSIIS
jgi:hypothetical protein